MTPAGIVGPDLESRPVRVGGHAAVEVGDEHLRPARLPHRELAVLRDQFGDGTATGMAQDDVREGMSLRVDPILDRRMPEDDPAGANRPRSIPHRLRSVVTRSVANQAGELGSGVSCRVRPVTPAEDPLTHHPAIVTSPS